MSQVPKSPFGDPAVSPFGGPVESTPSRFDGRTVKQDALESVINLLQQAPLTLNQQQTGPHPKTLPGLENSKLLPVDPNWRPEGPATPRSFAAETTTAAVRGVLDVTQSLAETAVGLIGGDEARRSLGRIVPYGPQPSSDSFANELGGFASVALTGPLAGSQSYVDVANRTEGNQFSALNAGVLSAAFSVLPAEGLAKTLPGVSKVIATLGRGKASKFVTKTVVESLANGTANVAQAQVEEAIARLGGATQREVNSTSAFVAGALGSLPFVGVREFAGRRALTRVRNELKRTGLMTDHELTLVGDRPELLQAISIARNQNMHVQIEQLTVQGKPKLTPDGLPDLKFTVTPDLVTQQEKALMGHAEPFIDALRQWRAKGGSYEINDPRVPWLAFPASRSAGLFKPPSELAKSASVQNRIAKVQRQALDRLLLLRTGLTALDLPQRVRLASRLDAEMLERITTLQGKDNDNGRGVRRKAQKVIDSLPPEQQVDVSAALNKALDLVAERFPHESQVGTMDRLIEAIDDGDVQLGGQAREGLVALRDRMLSGNPGYKPWGDRVRLAQAELRAVLEKVSDHELLAHRKRISELAGELPDDYRADLLDRAIKARDVNEMKAVVEGVSQAQNEYLRKTGISGIVDTVTKVGRNPRRDEVFGLLKKLEQAGVKPKVKVVNGKVEEAGAASAKPSAGPETIKAPAVKFEGKVYSQGNSHPEVLQNIVGERFGRTTALQMFLRDRATLTEMAKQTEQKGGKEVPSERALAAELTLKLLDLPDSANGFVTSNDRLLSRAEAGKLVGQAQALSVDLPVPGPVEPTKPKPGDPILVTSKKSGYVRVDAEVLQARLESLTTTQLKLLHDDILGLVRKGELEKGLYKRLLKGDLSEDAQQATRELGVHKDQSQVAERADKYLHVTKMAVDPVMIEAHLEQISRGDKQSKLYSILHGDLAEPYQRHLDNQAQRDRALDAAVRQHLGIDASGPLGKYKLFKYFNETLDTGVRRGHAMSLYALEGDVGRARDLETFGGVDERGNSLDLDAIEGLSDADRAFVDAVKDGFVNNPYMNKGFRNLILLTGKPVQLIKGWFPSVRHPEKIKLDADFATFSERLLKEIDPLKDRAENATGPFDIQDFYSTVLNITDKLSLYGELGREMFRAESLVSNEGFQQQWIRKFGKASYERLRLYLNNIHGNVGHNPTALDLVIDKAQAGWTVSKVGLNLWSAARQYFNFITLAADGTLRINDLAKAALGLRGFSKALRNEMLANSGLAYERFEGSHYLQNFLVQARDNRLPGKLSLLQHYAMFAQRGADRQVMTATWAAAKAQAAREGLTGQSLIDRTKQLFALASNRVQPTDNPLYATELEIQAKRSRLLRGALTFQREQNRIYNVVRRHVVAAVQQPTGANVAYAGRAVVLGVVANTMANLVVNELRGVVRAQVRTEDDRAIDAMSNLTGMYYLGGLPQTIAEGLIDSRKRHGGENLLSPIAQIASDVRSFALALGDAASAEGEVKSGVHRGESAQGRALYKALDSAVSVSSGLLGLPLWALWNEGKGVYRWTDDQLRLMTYFEAEIRQLKAQGSSPRLDQLELVRKRINEVHARRAKGLDPSTARREIESLLRTVVR